MLFIIETLQKK